MSESETGASKVDLSANLPGAWREGGVQPHQPNPLGWPADCNAFRDWMISVEERLAKLEEVQEDPYDRYDRLGQFPK